MLEGAQPSRARGKGRPGGETGLSGGRKQGRGCPRPPLTSVVVQLPHEAPQLLQDLVSHRTPPHAQTMEGAHGKLAGGLPSRPRREEDACEWADTMLSNPKRRRRGARGWGSGWGLTLVPSPGSWPWHALSPFWCDMAPYADPPLPCAQPPQEPLCCQEWGSLSSTPMAPCPASPQEQSW